MIPLADSRKVVNEGIIRLVVYPGCCCFKFPVRRERRKWDSRSANPDWVGESEWRQKVTKGIWHNVILEHDGATKQH